MHHSMSSKHNENVSPVVALKNESSRQRWELFHRAIAHAKESNVAALEEADARPDDGKPAWPLPTIVR